MNNNSDNHLTAVKTQKQLRAVRAAMEELSAQDRLDVMQAAKAALPEDERELIDEMADRLVEAVKKHNTRTALSKGGALEALAKLGIWINDRS